MSTPSPEAYATTRSQGGRWQTVTVDLTAVEYLDSGAINVLFTYADQIRVDRQTPAHSGAEDQRADRTDHRRIGTARGELMPIVDYPVPRSVTARSMVG